MIAGIEWSNLGYAGAFIVGSIAGSILTVRLFRIAVDLVKRQREER